MKAPYSTTIMMVFSLALQLLAAGNVQAQRIEVADLDTSSFPARLHIVVSKPDIQFSGLRYDTFPGAGNKQVIKLSFQGCGIANVITYLDTVIDIPAAMPYTLQVYTIWEPVKPCAYPTESLWTDSLTIVTHTPTGIPGIPDADSRFSIYPVPSSGLISLGYEKSIKVTAIRLTDMLGREAAAFQPEATTLDISRLVKGVYLLHISSTAGVLTRKIVLE